MQRIQKRGKHMNMHESMQVKCCSFFLSHLLFLFMKFHRSEVGAGETNLFMIAPKIRMKIKQRTIIITTQKFLPCPFSKFGSNCLDMCVCASKGIFFLSLLLFLYFFLSFFGSYICDFRIFTKTIHTEKIFLLLSVFRFVIYFSTVCQHF